MIRTLLILGFLSSTSFAQTIYRPVQFEYGAGDSKFYYGGSDLTVIARTERSLSVPTRLSNRPTITVSDAMPYQSNAAVYGYTANDAKNDAYGAQQRYFAMGGAPQSVAPEPRQSVGSIEIKPYVKPTTRAARW